MSQPRNDEQFALDLSTIAGKMGPTRWAAFHRVIESAVASPNYEPRIDPEDVSWIRLVSQNEFRRSITVKVGVRGGLSVQADGAGEWAVGADAKSALGFALCQ